jgi:hypothetical protein
MALPNKALSSLRHRKSPSVEKRFSTRPPQFFNPSVRDLFFLVLYLTLLGALITTDLQASTPRTLLLQ